MRHPTRPVSHASPAAARRMQCGIGWLVFSGGSLVVLAGLLQALRVSH